MPRGADVLQGRGTVHKPYHGIVCRTGSDNLECCSQAEAQKVAASCAVSQLATITWNVAAVRPRTLLGPSKLQWAKTLEWVGRFPSSRVVVGGESVR